MRTTSSAARGALVVAVSALGLALRLYRLGHDPLWFDEAYTALTAERPIGDILDLVRHEATAPLYYLLLHGWSAVMGDTDLHLRLLSALTGAAIVPQLYLVGAAMFTPAAGLVAATLAAVGPLHVHYSQELRMYGLVPLVALETLYGCDRLARRPDARGTLILAGSLTAGLYLHYFFLFLVPLALAAVWSPARPRALAHTAAALALAGLAFLPWAATLAAQAGPNHSLDWIRDWWANHRSLWTALPWSLAVLGPAALYPPYWFKLRSSTAGGIVSLAIALAVLGMAGVRIARDRDPVLRRALAVTLAAMLLPLVTAFVVSLLRAPIYVVGRYDIIAWAPYCLLVGAVVTELPTTLAAPAVALWIGLAASTLVPYFTTDRPVLAAANYGHVLADKLGRRAQTGDLVIFTASTRPTTEYYLGTWGRRLRMVSYPLGTDEHLGWIDVRIASDPAFAEDAARRMAAWVAALPTPPACIWLIEPATRGSTPLVNALQGLGYAIDRSRSDADVIGLRRAPPAETTAPEA